MRINLKHESRYWREGNKLNFLFFALFFLGVISNNFAQHYESVTVSGTPVGNITDNALFVASSPTISDLAFIRVQVIGGPGTGEFKREGDDIRYTSRPVSSGIPNNLSRIRFTFLKPDGVTPINPQDFRFVINDIDGPNNEALGTNCGANVRFTGTADPTNMIIDNVLPDLNATGSATESDGPTSRVMYEFNDISSIEFDNYANNGYLKDFDLDYDKIISTPLYSVCLDDSDGDGVLDNVDLDDDNDGILDSVEAGGNDPNGDHDGDGLPNYLDSDDNSGESATYMANADGSPTTYTDANNDGVPDVYESSIDSDFLANHLDSDSDGDGCNDVIEAGYTDANNDGFIDGTGFNPDGTVLGSDGYGAIRDIDLNATSDYLEVGPDADNDGFANACDVDPVDPCNPDPFAVGSGDCDGDGVTNAQEAIDSTDPQDDCSFLIANISLTVTSTNDCDGDGVTNAQEDLDGTNPLDGCLYLVLSQVIANVSPAWNLLDCDNDGNTNGGDLNPLSPSVSADAFTALYGSASTFNVLTNDDFVPGGNTSLVRTVTTGANNTAGGTVSFAALTGEISYTPTAAEAVAGGSVTVEYQVCNTLSGGVCGTAVVTITITDSDDDGDGVPNGKEIIDGTNPTDGCLYLSASQVIANVSSGWNLLDCDNDGVINGTEVTDTTDPRDPCSLVVANQTLTPLTAWNLLDCDNDGNTNGGDLNPLSPSVSADAFTALYGSASTFNVLTNDDFVPGGNTSLVRTVTTGANNTAGGTVSFAALTGEISYTPTAAEAVAGGSVTVEYQVCNTLSGGVCATAVVTITITDADDDGDGVPNGKEAVDGTNPNDGCLYLSASQVIANVSSAWNLLDCDDDGVINGTEVTDTTDPRDPCSLVVANQTLTPLTAWNLLDCDNDGNTNGGDLNPLSPSVSADAFTALYGSASTFNVLTNDDFVPGGNTSLVRTVTTGANNTAGGTVSFTASTGEISYTPTAAEAVAGGSVTVEYQVCNTLSGGVCGTAVVTITITDSDDDGDGVPNGKEIIDGTNPTDGCLYLSASQVIANVSSAWNLLDCDNDGVINGTEVTDTTDPRDPCSLVVANQTLTPLTIWDALDCDNDGNTNGGDLNPLSPSVSADAFTALYGSASTFNVLTNDDFVPGGNTSLVRTVTTGANNTAGGTVSFAALTGEISYTPTAAEAVAGGSVTVEYQVCNTLSGGVCGTAVVTITITDSDDDGDGVPNGKEIIDGTNPNDGCLYLSASQVIANVSSAWNLLDCDNDGVINGTEVTDTTDPRDPCSLVVANQTLTPLTIWDALDCDNDGNTNGGDLNPLSPSVSADAFTALYGSASTFNVLTNDDFVSGGNTSLVRTVTTGANNTAGGTVSFTASTGEISYTPTAAEAVAGGSVTVEYQVCNTLSGGVCGTAVVTITITDSDDDGDGVPNGKEIIDGTNPNDGCLYLSASQVIANVSSAWNLLDCDNDGVINGTEVTDTTDPRDPCSLVVANQTLTPLTAWNLLDCDNDGNTNGGDLNPLSPSVSADAFTALYGSASTFNVLTNDDFVPGGNTSLVRTVTTGANNTAGGTVSFAALTGEISYTPTAAEAVAGGSVTVEYQVCNTLSGGVCATAVVTITITDSDDDGDGVPNGKEIIDGTNPNDGCLYLSASQVIANVSSAWNLLDCDDDGVINGTEVTDTTDPRDPCSLVVANQTLTPLTAWNLLDCDNDGNTNGGDLNPLSPSVSADAFTALYGSASTFNVLTNDDFVPGGNTSLVRTVTTGANNTAGGTVSFAALTGEISYTPTAAEAVAGGSVTVEYQVCNTLSGGVCATAVVTITITDSDDDGDGVPNGKEIIDGTNPNDGCLYLSASQVIANVSSAWNLLDCDDDGVINGTEVTDTTDPRDPCSLVVANQTLTPLTAWNLLDCDNDGNTNGGDLNPLSPSVSADAFTALYGSASTFNVLTNDDFVPGGNTSLVRTVTTGANNTAGGTVSFTASTGEISYTPTAAEAVAGGSVTVEYQVCNTLSGGVCGTAVVTITITDSDDDGDGVPNGKEIIDGTNPTDGCLYLSASQVIANVSSGWNLLDCDNDGVINGTEVTGTTDPRDPCSLVVANQTLTPLTIWDALDCDNDGNTNGGDLNPLVPTAVADAFTATYGTATVYDILANDDFVAGVTTSITQTGTTGAGVIVLDGTTGEISYSPTEAEALAGGTVIVSYQVCNTLSGGSCATALVTISIIDADDDGDGVPNAKEVSDGTNPNDGCSYELASQVIANVSSGWNALDCDGDGVINGLEITNSTDLFDPCSYNLADITETITATQDCDGDGVTNEQEVLDGTDPKDACSLVILSQTVATSSAWDTSDCDGDGVSNKKELEDGTLPFDSCDLVIASQDLTPSTAWQDADCDGDLITNGQELLDNTDPFASCDNIGGTPLGDSDCDNDGLTYDEELTIQHSTTDPVKTTDPNNPDTDNDGILDGREVADGTNPLDPCDHINGTTPEGTTCGIEIANELITPNGDTTNEYFKIKGIKSYPENTVEVFNRWGVSVFKIDSYDNEANVFRGESNGRATLKQEDKLPSGVYFYIISYKDGEDFKKKTGYLYVN